MSNDDPQARQRLALLLAGGGMKCRRLVAEIPPHEGLIDSLADRGVPTALIRTARDLTHAEVPTLLRRVRRAGWRWLTPGAPEFPDRLVEISDPPLGLFVNGRLGKGPWVTVVGSRQATAYGRQVARLLGSELASAGVVIVSGMARGVDAAAHEGALAASGTTWAVWGTGPDRIYPPEHGRLAKEIARQGALITEYPPGTPPRRHHFPERNRLLAGIGDAVVVVEAAARSGALSTARQAVDEGRDVYAVPGSIFSDLSVGPNAMLRVGAQPLLNPNDILRSLEIPAAPKEDSQSQPPHSLFEVLAPGEALSPDEIARRADRPVSEVLEAILEMELAGDIERQPDGRYSRVRGPESGGV